MAKNYIEQFMEDNKLSVNTYFEVYGYSGWYMFDSDFVLWYKPVKNRPAVDGSTTLVELLTGRCRLITKMEQVAEILGVKLGEKFDIDKNGIELPVGPFMLTERGLKDEDSYDCPTYFVKLLTGEYKIVPIEQEES